MNWDWTRTPPVMERSIWDDLKSGAFVLLGAVLGYIVFGADDPGLLLGGVIGIALVIVVLNIIRRVRPRHKT